MEAQGLRGAHRRRGVTRMLRFKPLPIMTIVVIAAFAVLVTLGDWQRRRYEEKRDAIAAPNPEITIADYTPVEEGVQFVYGILNGSPGWRVFAPVREGDELVFVDAEFVPGVAPPALDEVRFPASLTHGAPIAGRSVRPGPISPFASPPSPADRTWYAVDLSAMAMASGFEQAAAFYVATDYVGEDGRALPNPFGQGGNDPLPPERHMGYAITWWSLAAILIAVYFAYHITTGRLRFGVAREGE
ncbi:MAG: hypothetical protein GC189_13330 [Alphaproteobacteria bacterium]|nr:hypothetical protein [Alphaproteobacteria bacterium]